MNTTLNKIRAHAPCSDGWKKLLKHLGKTEADDEPLSIKTILESNGVDDAIWCLQAVEGKDKEIRLFAVWCARQVQHLMTDKRSLDALDVAERFANGLASEEELRVARDAARDAAWAAGDAAWDAWDAARAAAARDAARATWDASMNAAYAALGTALEAAYAAAWSAARAAAWDAAGDAAKEAQTKKLIEICEGLTCTQP